LSLATEAAGAGAWVLDAQAGRFWVGSQIWELLGLPPGDSLDVDRFMGLVHPEDQERVSEIMEQALQSRELTIVEYRIVRPDGEVRWMQSRGRVTATDPSDPARLTGMTADITERRHSEDELREALDEVHRLREQLQSENVYLREQIRTRGSHEAIVGESEPVQEMLALARQVAPTESAVLITGETGTGKELLAQAIHDLSPRRDKIMVKVNCAALPAPLIESELFGREKGAYTGAMSRQAGRFEVADGSTIFLDEIGDLPLHLQAKLLRVLQDGRYERLGDNRTLTTDVRVIAATNHDLAAMMQRGEFREDLFHRLNVFPIEVPPLRARDGDIPLLVWKIVAELNEKMGRSIDTIPKETMERLQQYSWPGNVRELRNVIERAMIVSDGRSLEVGIPDEESSRSSVASTLEEVERRHIRAVLERVHWRISGTGGAAEILGLPPTTLHSRMKRLGLSRPRS
jgi:PAS domain S-box-containing protein